MPDSKDLDVALIAYAHQLFENPEPLLVDESTSILQMNSVFRPHDSSCLRHLVPASIPFGSGCIAKLIVAHNA